MHIFQEVIHAAHSADPFPHPANCVPCALTSHCSVCGANLRGDPGRCTNGHCGLCHRDCCTTGGATSPGHAPGTEADRRVTYGRRLAERPRPNAKPHDERSDYYSGKERDDL